MKKKKIRCFDVNINESEVYAISLVDFPAIESDFVYLNIQNEVKLSNVDNLKHQIVGAVLIPDKPIYRIDDETGEEYYIKFSAETIEKLAHDYIGDGKIYSITKDHEKIADDVYVIESFIKQTDNELYGIDVPKGSWMVMCKVDNDEVWESIVNGERNGFSIESFLSFDEINNFAKINKNMTEELETVEIDGSFWEKIKAIVKEALAPIPVDEPLVEEVAENIAEDIVEETKPEEEVMEETPVEETPVAEEAADVAKQVVEEAIETENPEATDAEKVDEEIAALKATIDSLNQVIEEKQMEIDELKKANQKLSKTPSIDSITNKNEEKMKNFNSFREKYFK